MCKKISEKETDFMTTATVKYNKDIFLAELEESLKEMKEMKARRKSKIIKTERSSWRDLFTKEEK